ncbi:MAG TPA: patatin-like phospholipase family protein [Longimicrobiales bacterium]
MSAGAARRPPRWALALGGGAARGIAHVGIMRVLEREGLTPDLVVGTSAGALAGVFLAAGVSADRTAVWGESLRWSTIARPIVSRLGLMSNERMGELLGRALPVRTFDELAIPFACIATDLGSAESVLLREGDLISAIRASCAIPGLIVPVERDGRLFVDGGVTDNVPTAAARGLGAEIVVAVDVNQAYRRPQPPSNMFEILVDSFFTVGRAAERLATADADVLITPDIGDIGFEQLGRATELIAAGDAAARLALPRLRALLAGAPAADAPTPVPSEVA